MDEHTLKIRVCHNVQARYDTLAAAPFRKADLVVSVRDEELPAVTIARRVSKALAADLAEAVDDSLTGWVDDTLKGYRMEHDQLLRQFIPVVPPEVSDFRGVTHWAHRSVLDTDHLARYVKLKGKHARHQVKVVEHEKEYLRARLEGAL